MASDILAKQHDLRMRALTSARMTSSTAEDVYNIGVSIIY